MSTEIAEYVPRCIKKPYYPGPDAGVTEDVWYAKLSGCRCELELAHDEPFCECSHGKFIGISES